MKSDKARISFELSCKGGEFDEDLVGDSDNKEKFSEFETKEESFRVLL